jgi:hypothetical protein
MNNVGRLTCAMTLFSLVACSSPSITNVTAPEPTGGATSVTGTGGALTVGGTSGSSTTSSIGATGGTTSNSQATGGASAGAATGGSNNGGNVATGGTLQGGTTSAPSSGGAATGGTAPNGSTTGGAATGGVSPTGGRATDGGAPTGGRTGLTLTGGTTSGPATGGAATGGRPPTGGATSGGGSSYTLTVSFMGSGSGTVTITPGNTVCKSPATCTATFPSGTAVTLTAKPTNTGTTVTSVVGVWRSGGGSTYCSGINRICALTINANVSATARFEPLTANLVFASSATFLGNLGSAAAYQTQCNKLATDAGINNSTNDAYIAWMAASNYDPRTLLSASRGWVRLDLLPWIDDMAVTLTSGAVYYPVAYDENGQRVIDYTLSGMSSTGALYTGYNCNDWSDVTLKAARSHTHVGARGWPYGRNMALCNTASRILCVMKGMSTPVTVTPVSGKKIYLTKSAWVPGGGVADADAKCMTDAPASVTSAKAILVASTRALADVLGATTVYVRPDGIRVGSGGEIAQAMNATAPISIESTVTQNGAGAYVDPNTAQDVWTGLSRAGSVDKDTCRDWVSNASTDSGTGGTVASGWVSSGKNGNFTCSGELFMYLQCAEQ